MNKQLPHHIRIQSLILFGIYSVINKGEICTYERLVAECFQLFPEVFGFKRYPQWPDSLKFDRPLRTLREEGLIVGSVRDHFELTEFGKRKAQETKSFLNAGGIVFAKEISSKGRSVEDKLIEYLRGSELFRKFLTNPESFTISELELRSLLRCTLETPKRVVKQNLEYYKNVAKSYKEEKILQFLSVCETELMRKGGEIG